MLLNEIKFLNKLQKNPKRLSSIRKKRLKKQGLMQCYVCYNVKPINECNSSQICNVCNRKRIKLYYKKNKDKVNSRNKKWKKGNINRVSEISKNGSKRYRQNNKERVKEYSRYYYHSKLKNNYLAKLANNIRNRLRHALKSGNFKKQNDLYKNLGCSIVELKFYLETKFDQKMSWSNYGSYWHIDHIIPLSSAKTISEMDELCYYTNLQPLTAADNIKKGAKMPPL